MGRSAPVPCPVPKRKVLEELLVIRPAEANVEEEEEEGVDIVKVEFHRPVPDVEEENPPEEAVPPETFEVRVVFNDEVYCPSRSTSAASEDKNSDT